MPDGGALAEPSNGVSGGFTDAQQRAIEAGDGPVRIIAGPGCGKSTLLAARIAHLVRDRGADPSSVLAVTFTAEAARRLRHEVGRQLDRPATDLAIHTLHAFGRKVIGTWPGRFGFSDSTPTVIHRDEARDLLTRAAAGLGWDLSNISPGELAVAVDRCRLGVDTPSVSDGPLAELALAYEEQLLGRSAIDFPAMLSWPLRLPLEDAQVGNVLQSAYRWVVIDEVQDLAPVQLALVQLLSAPHGNLTVAGDPSQSIFMWLGADPSFLLDFPRLYPGAATFHLNHAAPRRFLKSCRPAAPVAAASSPPRSPVGEHGWRNRLTGLRSHRDEAASQMGSCSTQCGLCAMTSRSRNRRAREHGHPPTERLHRQRTPYTPTQACIWPRNERSDQDEILSRSTA